MIQQEEERENGPVNTTMRSKNSTKSFFNVKGCDDEGVVCLTTLDFIGDGSTLMVPQLVTAILLCILNMALTSVVVHLLRELKQYQGTSFGIIFSLF